MMVSNGRFHSIPPPPPRRAREWVPPPSLHSAGLTREEAHHGFALLGLHAEEWASGLASRRDKADRVDALLTTPIPQPPTPAERFRVAMDALTVENLRGAQR